LANIIEISGAGGIAAGLGKYMTEETMEIVKDAYKYEKFPIQKGNFKSTNGGVSKFNKIAKVVASIAGIVCGYLAGYYLVRREPEFLCDSNDIEKFLSNKSLSYPIFLKYTIQQILKRHILIYPVRINYKNSLRVRFLSKPFKELPISILDASKYKLNYDSLLTMENYYKQVYDKISFIDDDDIKNITHEDLLSVIRRNTFWVNILNRKSIVEQRFLFGCINTNDIDSSFKSINFENLKAHIDNRIAIPTDSFVINRYSLFSHSFEKNEYNIIYDESSKIRGRNRNRVYEEESEISNREEDPLYKILDKDFLLFNYNLRSPDFMKIIQAIGNDNYDKSRSLFESQEKQNIKIYPNDKIPNIEY
jgi:hypothetical protein